MAADTDAYRVTHKDGRAVYCNRRSLAGKLSLFRSQRDQADRWGWSIVKIERAPIGAFEDVTGEFL